MDVSSIAAVLERHFKIFIMQPILKNSNNLDATINQAVKKAMSGLGSISEELKAKLDSCLIDMKAVYPKTEFLFSVDGVKVLSLADVHTIGAKQKAGKTSLVKIFIATILSGQWHRVKCLLRNAKVLYIDTEMKRIDTQNIGKNAAQMAGIDPTEIGDRIHLVNFRPLSPKQMEQGMEYYIKVYNPDLVIVDGIVDLCSNFNDVEASQNLVLNFLMKLAEEHQCAILNVLHTNKTDNYVELRGHLGAYFEQKGATVIKCEKDDDTNIVTVKFPTHRYAPVPDFHFTFDNEGIPVCADTQYQAIEDARKHLKEEQKAADVQKVYEERAAVVISIIKEHEGAMERKELSEKVMSKLDRKSGVVKGLLKQMLSEPNPRIVQTDSIISLSE